MRLRNFLCLGAWTAALPSIFLLTALAPAEARQAPAAIVVDANTGRTLHAEAADEERFPASLTKMMTLYLVFEELAAKGIFQLELGPNTSLTDFARETAEQLDVALIDGRQGAAQPQAVSPSSPPAASRLQAAAAGMPYNKPRGCQAGAPREIPQGASKPVKAADPSDSAPVNRLVDLMGKIIKRGE